MSVVFVAILTLAGFACLALSMARHARAAFNRMLPRRAVMALRASGWVALAAALALCAVRWGTSVGIVVWLGASSVLALIVALSLTYIVEKDARGSRSR